LDLSLVFALELTPPLIIGGSSAFHHYERDTKTALC